MGLIENILFNNPDLFNFDSNLLTVDGTGHLKLIHVDQDFIEDFDNDTGFIYNVNEAEFIDGKVQQKARALLNEQTFAASFYTQLKAQLGLGDLTITGYNGATITDNKLDLSGGVANKYIIIDADQNADSQQTGCVMLKYIPNYSGSPSAIQYMFTIAKSSSDSTNMISVYHSSNGQIYIWCRDENTSTIFQAAKGVWSPTAGITYFIQFNYNFTNQSTGLYINGSLFGSLQTQNFTRSSDIGVLMLGRGTGALTNQNWFCDGLVYFSDKQLVVSDFPTNACPNYRYSETSVILLEMEHIGDGTIINYNSFSLTYGYLPRVLLEIGRSGNNLYWNGSTWVISNNSYAQATDPNTFNTNSDALPVEGENYGTHTIVFPETDNQNYVSQLVANMHIDAYGANNPYMETITPLSHEGLINFLATLSIIGLDNITFNLYKNNDLYWFNISAWEISNGGYAQSNIANDILANINTFTTIPINSNLRIYFHSEDGTTTPHISIIEIEYNFYGNAEDTINKCIVWGWQLDQEGNPDQTPFTIALNKDQVYYKNNTIITREIITVTPTLTGYWEAEVIENENMEVGSFYNWTFGTKVYALTVKNQSTDAFTNLQPI